MKGGFFMNKNFNENQIPKEAKNLLKQNGIDYTNLKNTNTNNLLKNLKPEDANKINTLLNDKEALDRLLKSDKAKEIMNKFFGAK